MVDPHNTRERLSNALDSLVGAGPIKDRLRTAALTLVPLKADDFPSESQRVLFEQIRADLAKLSGTPDEGHIEATIEGMDEQQAVTVARRIARLFYLVAFADEAG